MQSPTADPSSITPPMPSFFFSFPILSFPIYFPIVSSDAFVRSGERDSQCCLFFIAVNEHVSIELPSRSIAVVVDRACGRLPILVVSVFGVVSSPATLVVGTKQLVAKRLSFLPAVFENVVTSLYLNDAVVERVWKGQRSWLVKVTTFLLPCTLVVFLIDKHRPVLSQARSFSLLRLAVT